MNYEEQWQKADLRYVPDPNDRWRYYYPHDRRPWADEPWRSEPWKPHPLLPLVPIPQQPQPYQPIQPRKVAPIVPPQRPDGILPPNDFDVELNVRRRLI